MGKCAQKVSGYDNKWPCMLLFGNQVDARLDKLRKDVVMYEKEQKQTFEQVNA